jgi:hypothetical protein
MTCPRCGKPTAVFGDPNFLTPLLGASPNAGIRNGQATDFLQNLFGEIVFDLAVEPNGLLGHNLTPMVFAHAQLFLEGEKDPVHTGGSRNSRVWLLRHPYGSLLLWTWVLSSAFLFRKSDTSDRARAVVRLGRQSHFGSALAQTVAETLERRPQFRLRSGAVSLHSSRAIRQLLFRREPTTQLSSRRGCVGRGVSSATPSQFRLALLSHILPQTELHPGTLGI